MGKFSTLVLNDRSDPSVMCFVLQVCAKKPTQCFGLWVSIKKLTYWQLLTFITDQFCRSNRMFVDVYTEYVAWSYWWTWCVLPIICNSKHFSFFVFYFNLSNKISSTHTGYQIFNFTIHLLLLVYSNPLSMRHSRVD